MGTIYKEIGVDISYGDYITDCLEQQVGIQTGFAAAHPLGFANAMMVTSTDGVGSKVRFINKHFPYSAPAVLGQDVVAAVFNDIITTGAAPAQFLDYIGSPSLDATYIVPLVEAMHRACQRCGAKVVGGETAEMPKTYATRDDMDLVGFGVGFTDKNHLIDGGMIVQGDVLIGLPSSGLHANGYTLINHLVEEEKLDPATPGLATPTKLYHPILRAMIDRLAEERFDNFLLKNTLGGFANITGGGLVANVERMFRREHNFMVEYDWEAIKELIPEVFLKIQEAGSIEMYEMFQVFNMGIGFVLCVNRDRYEPVMVALEKAGTCPLIIGHVVDGVDNEPDW